MCFRKINLVIVGNVVRRVIGGRKGRVRYDGIISSLGGRVEMLMKISKLESIWAVRISRK